jgi:tetratricopeptide (TPR) repeat protein
MENIISLMFTILGGALLFFVFVYFVVLISVGIQLFVNAVTRCKKLPKQLTLPVKQYRLFRQTDDWATENGFHYVGMFTVPRSLLGGWENPETSSSMTLYLNFGSFYLEFNTVCDNNIVLETGNLRFGTLLLPLPPGFYVQHFPKKRLEELWELHNEAVQYLTEEGGAHLTPFCPDLPWGNIPSTDLFAEQKPSAFETMQTSGIRTINKYIYRHFLLFLYTPFCCFYRPFFWIHKTIQKQVEMGRFVLPQELPPNFGEQFIHWSPKKQLDGFELMEPLERSTFFSETESNANTTKLDASTLYSREYAVEPKTAGYFSQAGGILVSFFILFFGIVPIFNWIVSNHFDNRMLEEVKRSLATANIDEALEKAVKIRQDSYKNQSLVLVAEEYASAERYDDALKTVSLVSALPKERVPHPPWSIDNPFAFIVSAKAADEQFDGLDEIIRQIDSEYHRNDAYHSIAIAQAKAGLIDEAEKTLDKLDNEESKKRTKLSIANAIFDLGQTGEAIAIFKTIQDTQLNSTKIWYCCEFAGKLAKDGNIETTRQLLFDALELMDKAEKFHVSQLQSVLSVFRNAGKPEEGLRFIQEIATRYPIDEKKENEENETDEGNEKNEKPTWTEFTPYSAVLYETAILNIELGNYAEGWKILESIPFLFENLHNPHNSSQTYKCNELLTEFFRTGQKHNVNMKMEMKRIEKILQPALDAAIDPETETSLLRRLLDFQVTARCFDDAVTTAKRREKIKGKYSPPTVSYFWGAIAAEQAKAGKIEDALETIKKVKSKSYVWQEIVLAEVKADRFDEAVQHLSHCNKRDREPVLNGMIKICIDKEKLTEAEKLLELFKSPENKVTAILSLSEAHLKSESELGSKEVAERLVAQTIPLMNQCLEPSWDHPKPEQFLRIAVLNAKLGHFSEALSVVERISILEVSKRVTALRAIADAQTAAGNSDNAQKTREKIRWRFAKTSELPTE